jgi:hypothetical protein
MKLRALCFWILAILFIGQMFVGCDLRKNKDFIFERSFEVTVPEDFYSRSAEEVYKSAKTDFPDFDWRIILADSLDVRERRLRVGKKYEVVVYRPTRVVTSEECLKFIRKKGIPVGARGIYLVWKRSGIEYDMISFYQGKRLPIDRLGHYLLPVITKDEGCWNGFSKSIIWRFRVANQLKTNWGDETQIICFKKKQ